MKRGDIVTVAVRGDYGKPRPALVAQADAFNETHASVTVLPLTSNIVDAPLFRLTIDPSRQNGLARVSQVMVDKAITLPRAKIGKVVGQLGDDPMIRVSRALSVWLGIA
ncbi:MAG TPA: type II toxin-antitoxin system PemK/MazF family toxin [Woeseiaceae bacterium]|nr:type II toxin-antitoxin system PemK/MazF family toxin [Woeseiaceae bacterium]